MTPKKKAEELIELMYETIDAPQDHDGQISYNDEVAKRCALVVVDEIIKILPDGVFWQQVKEEIENYEPEEL
jgi:hypothetical protein